jgi:parvulin-like peptidyl-prolyl isomerase
VTRGGVRRARRRAAGTAFGVAALLAAGCGRGAPPPGPDVAARIAGADVRYEEFELYLRRNVGEGAGALASQALSRLLDEFLSEESLRRLAVDRGLVDPAAERAQAAEALLAAAPRPAPTAAEIAAFYAAHLADYERPERVELRQVLSEDRTAAERARRELAAGAPFATVVSRLGAAGTSASGELGTLARDELPAAFADAVFGLRDGEVSPVLAAEYGFHVFQVVRRLPAETLPLEAARADVVRRLAGESADRAHRELVAAARSRYAVEVYDRNLPFNYRGAFPVARPYETH